MKGTVGTPTDVERLTWRQKRQKKGRKKNLRRIAHERKSHAKGLKDISTMGIPILIKKT